jgi:chromosome partitioning protein
VTQAVPAEPAIQATQVPQALQWPAGWPWPHRRLAVCNQKGGQGKTTTTVELAADFAAAGARVLLIDADPQIGSATFWLPPDYGDVTDSRLRSDLLSVLMDEATLAQATWPTTVPGLSIVPSYHSAAAFEVQRPPGAEMVLRQALDEAAGEHDVVLVDCAPSLGLLTVGAITAVDEAIIACKPGSLDLAGVADLNKTLTTIQKRLNPQLRVAAVAVCMSSPTIFDRMLKARLLEDYPRAVHQAIRSTVRVAEAPQVHAPLREYAPKSTAARDYATLAWRLYHPEAGH